MKTMTSNLRFSLAFLICVAGCSCTQALDTGTKTTRASHGTQGSDSTQGPTSRGNTAATTTQSPTSNRPFVQSTTSFETEEHPFQSESEAIAELKHDEALDSNHVAELDQRVNELAQADIVQSTSAALDTTLLLLELNQTQQDVAQLKSTLALENDLRRQLQSEFDTKVSALSSMLRDVVLNTNRLLTNSDNDRDALAATVDSLLQKQTSLEDTISNLTSQLNDTEMNQLTTGTAVDNLRGDVTGFIDVNNVRFVNGGVYYGRVEVFYNGTWGTVCDDGFDGVEARVLCRSLGYNHGEATGKAYYGQGRGQIWLDDISCSGSEKSIFDCATKAIGSNNCSHREDVSVECWV